MDRADSLIQLLNGRHPLDLHGEEAGKYEMHAYYFSMESISSIECAPAILFALRSYCAMARRDEHRCLLCVGLARMAYKFMSEEAIEALDVPDPTFAYLPKDMVVMCYQERGTQCGLELLRIAEHVQKIKFDAMMGVGSKPSDNRLDIYRDPDLNINRNKKCT